MKKATNEVIMLTYEFHFWNLECSVLLKTVGECVKISGETTMFYTIAVKWKWLWLTFHSDIHFFNWRHSCMEMSERRNQRMSGGLWTVASVPRNKNIYWGKKRWSDDLINFQVPRRWHSGSPKMIPRRTCTPNLIPMPFIFLPFLQCVFRLPKLYMLRIDCL